MENNRHIYCNMCEMQLNKGEEVLILCSYSSLCYSNKPLNLSLILTYQVNLNILQERLAEAHAEHLERGCRLKPKFSVQSVYNLKALYITCEVCNTFEVVV